MNLLSLIGAVGLSGLTPLSVPQQQENENYQIIYKFETNDVNSLDDLVVGNIYKFTFLQSYQGDDVQSLFTMSNLYNLNYLGGNFNIDIQSVSDNDYLLIRVRSSDALIQTSSFTVLTSIIWNRVSFPYSFNFVYLSHSSTAVSTYGSLFNVSRSDFNVIESVTPIEPSTSDIYNVTEDYIYNLFDSDLDSYTFTIGNQSITLRKWLAITIAIVVIILLVIILALIVRWIVRLFVNCFNRI